MPKTIACAWVPTLELRQYNPGHETCNNIVHLRPTTGGVNIEHNEDYPDGLLTAVELGDRVEIASLLYSDVLILHCYLQELTKVYNCKVLSATRSMTKDGPHTTTYKIQLKGLPGKLVGDGLPPKIKF